MASHKADNHDAQLLYFKSMSPEASATSNNGLYVCCKWTANKATREGACGNFISLTSVKFCKNLSCQKPLCWYCPLCNRVLTPTFRSRHNHDQHNIASSDAVAAPVRSGGKSKGSSQNVGYQPYQLRKQVKKEKEGKVVQSMAKMNLAEKTLDQIQEEVVPRKEVQQMVKSHQGSGNYTQPTDSWVPSLLSITPSVVHWVGGKIENLVLVATNIPEEITLQYYKSLEEEKPEGDLPISGRFTNSANVKPEDLHTIFATVLHPQTPTTIYIAIRSSASRSSNRVQLQFINPPVSSISAIPADLRNIQVDPGFFEQIDSILQLDSEAQGAAWEGSYTDLLVSFSKGLTDADLDGIALLVAAVLGNNDKHCVAFCLAYRFVCLGWSSEESFDQLLEICKNTPNLASDHLINEINKELNIANFSQVLEVIVTHIKSIATLYGGYDYYSHEQISSADAIICDYAPDYIRCAICQELLTDPVSAPCCKQLFCTGCISQWLSENEDGNQPTCPTCRADIALEQCTRATSVEKLKVYIRCQHCAGQFHWTIFNSHMENCGKVPVRCRWECGKEDLTKEQKIAHEQWCAEQVRPCIYCDAYMRQDALLQHTKSACLLAPPAPPTPVVPVPSSPKEPEKSPKDQKGKGKEKETSFFGQITSFGASIIDRFIPASSPNMELPSSVYEDYNHASDESKNKDIWKRKVAAKLKRFPLTQDVEAEIIGSLNVAKMSEWLKYQSLKSDKAKVLDCKLLLGLFNTSDPKWQSWKSQWDSTRFTPETHPFGNVHTVAIQIGCAVISWQPSSLVKVDRSFPENTVIALNLSDIVPAVMNNDTVYEKVAQVIVKWNAARKYDLKENNPQLFVKDLLKNGLGISSLPIPPIFENYLDALRRGIPFAPLSPPTTNTTSSTQSESMDAESTFTGHNRALQSTVPTVATKQVEGVPTPEQQLQLLQKSRVR